MKFDGKAIGLYAEILQAAQAQGIHHKDVFVFEIADDLSGNITITTIHHQRHMVKITGPIHVYAVEGSIVLDEEPRQIAEPIDSTLADF